MGDVLTQVQDELNNLLHQMTAALVTIRLRAPPAAIPGQPVLSSFAEHGMQQAAQQSAQNAAAGGAQQATGQYAAIPDGPAVEAPKEASTNLPLSGEGMQEQLRELSQDLVAKEQQLEVLIKALPGTGVTEREQMEKMEALEKELEAAEVERKKVVEERQGLIEEVERAIMGVGGKGVRV